VNPVLITVCAVLAAGLYLVGLALDLFWLKLLTKPWLVFAWPCPTPSCRA
jgi:hypothetical protein